MSQSDRQTFRLPGPGTAQHLNGKLASNMKTIYSLIKIFSFCSRITIRITFYTLCNLTIMVFLFNDERIEVNYFHIISHFQSFVVRSGYEVRTEDNSWLELVYQRLIKSALLIHLNS